MLGFLSDGAPLADGADACEYLHEEPYLAFAQLSGWSEGGHLVSYRWGRIKKDKISDCVFVGCL